MEPCDTSRLTPGGFLWRCARTEHPDDPGNHYFIHEPDDERKPGNDELESTLEAFFRKRVAMLNGHAFKLVPVQAGIPDRCVLMPGGHIFLVELKQNSGEVSEVQRLWHARRLEDQQVKVHVVYGRKGVTDWLRHIVSAISAESQEPAPVT